MMGEPTKSCTAKNSSSTFPLRRPSNTTGYLVCKSCKLCETGSLKSNTLKHKALDFRICYLHKLCDLSRFNFFRPILSNKDAKTAGPESHNFLNYCLFLHYASNLPQKHSPKSRASNKISLTFMNPPF